MAEGRIESQGKVRTWHFTRELDDNNYFKPGGSFYGPEDISVRLHTDTTFEYPEMALPSRKESRAVRLKSIDLKRHAVSQVFKLEDFFTKYHFDNSIAEGKIDIDSHNCTSLEDIYLTVLEQNNLIRERRRGGPLLTTGYKENCFFVKDRKGNLFLMKIKLKYANVDTRRVGPALGNQFRWQAHLSPVLADSIFSPDRILVPDLQEQP